MRTWQKGKYNANYVLNQPGLVEQYKYECVANTLRIEEICIERYESGSVALVFAISEDATDESRPGGYHARVAYNSLMQDLQDRFYHPKLKITTTNDEVHHVKAKKGQERLLHQILTRLEQYDNSLQEIRKELLAEMSSYQPTLAEIEDAMRAQKNRLELLAAVKAQESKKRTPRAAKKTTRRKATKKRVVRRRKAA